MIQTRMIRIIVNYALRFTRCLANNIVHYKGSIKTLNFFHNNVFVVAYDVKSGDKT